MDKLGPTSSDPKYPIKARVRKGWGDEYKVVDIIGPPVIVSGVSWTPIVAEWDINSNYGEDPTFFKSRGLEEL